MATAVVLLPVPQNEESLRRAALTTLAGLGVTGLAVVGDDRTLGLVVEGWAFDPRRSAEALTATLAASPAGARTLYPLLEMALSPAAVERNGRPSQM